MEDCKASLGKLNSEMQQSLRKEFFADGDDNDDDRDDHDDDEEDWK